jgi:hypothetical protein
MKPLTRKFTDTIKANLRESKAFRRALLTEIINCIISGDVKTGLLVLREYINGTIGFIALGEALKISPKNLTRIFNAEGNPRPQEFFAIVAYLQKIEGIELRIKRTGDPA